jgi:hypothetical protein
MVVTMEFSNRGKAGSSTHAPMSYELLISSIAEIHARTQAGAAGAVTRYLTLRKWAAVAAPSRSGPQAAKNSGLQLGNARSDEALLPHLPSIERERLATVRDGIG